MSTKKTGDTEVIAENTKKTEQKPRTRRTYNRKTVSNSDEKSVQEKVSEDSRSTKSIVKSVTRRGRGQRAGGGKKLKVIPLGGLHEIGKNITCFEYDNEILVLDCGVAFPEDDMLGIDLVIPDFTYLLNNRDKVKGARIIANPGCYTTCSILSIYPMVKEGLIDPKSIIVDAKSGTSGAGRGAKVPNLFCEVNENIKAYGVTTHRHTPEIEEQLSYAAGEEVMINFTPHLVPMQRGILVTAYANLKKPVSYEEVKAAYDKYYGDEFFIRVLNKDETPETRWVEGSNFVDVGFKIDERTNRIVMMGALDNLIKGAAGQAVQNMNILFGLPESEGLQQVPMFP